MEVIKRDGRIVPFEIIKIQNATFKAFPSPKGPAEFDICNEIAEEIYEDFKNKDRVKIIDIENKIIAKLNKRGLKKVAKDYKDFRDERTKVREKASTLMIKIMSRINAENVENSNANVDERSFSGKEKEASADVQKFMAIDLEGLDKEIAQAHKDMLLYQHDLEKALVGAHNCLNLNFQEIFTYGFTTRNGTVRPPKSFRAACQLMAVAFQLQSQVQFGGCGSIHADFDLAPFIKMSFAKHFETGRRYIRERVGDVELPLSDEWHIDDIMFETYYPQTYQYAMDMLREEVKQSCEALWHNLNTLESRAGSQVPFVSLNYGRDTSPEGRMVTKGFLEASLNGIGKYHLTSIFPISIFQLKAGVNRYPGDPNYDLYQLALKSLSKRIYPNIVNCDWSQAHEDPDNIDTYMSSMGCRTMLGYDRHGLGYIRQGRGNNVPNTIILPKLGIEYGICLGERGTPDLNGFWNAFENALLLAEKGLMNRYDFMKKQSPAAAPFMYLNNTIQDARNCTDTVENALKHNTFAIGFIGIAEMCQALFGKNHVYDKDVWNFAYSVVKRINEFALEASERNDLNFSCYATPAEGLCHTAAKALRSQYGIIPNVTDREFLTNSFHVPVWEEVSVKKKLETEAPFTKLCTGGTITYTEYTSTFMQNTKAIEDIIEYATATLDIPYLAFNFPIDSCTDCGYQGEFNDACPECGSENILQLRRVTGYLSADYRQFNKGKIEETKRRFKNSTLEELNV